eukprot:1144113-Pelagomonas_calceolata.AAC.4
MGPHVPRALITRLGHAVLQGSDDGGGSNGGGAAAAADAADAIPPCVLNQVILEKRDCKEIAYEKLAVSIQFHKSLNDTHFLAVFCLVGATNIWDARLLGKT